MPKWTKVAMDEGLGLVAGAVDQFAQTQDEIRAAKYAADNPGKEMSFWKQYGTYVNFLLPVAGLIGIALGYPKNDENVARVALVGGQLAGRKLVHRFYKPEDAPVSPAPYTEYHRIAAARQSAARQAAEQSAARQAATRTYEQEFAQAHAF